MLKFDAVLFDFDGTLMDSGEGVKKSIIYALHAMGIEENDWEKLDYFIGPPLWDSFMRKYGMNREQADWLVEKYRERYNEKGASECVIYDGIPALLQALRAAGVRIGIASSKPLPIIRNFLTHFQLEESFDAVSGAALSGAHSDKEDLIRTAMELLGMTDPSRVLMVGDRHFDIDGARRARVKSVGVLYGYGSREELAQAGANFLAGTPAEVLPLVLSN